MDSSFADNFSWMIFNILLAVIPILLANLFYGAKKPFTKSIFFISWLFFVPNTIYIFTDILHYFDQIKETDLLGAILLTMQYAVLLFAGFLTYIFSMYPIEKKLSPTIVIGVNFLIGFGVVLGRVYRLNSWDIIIGIENVIYTVLHTVDSPRMIMLAVLFGLFANFMYFLFRKRTIKCVAKIKKKI